jgi:CubicO group peptidase (beta-lactamase class C family)
MQKGAQLHEILDKQLFTPLNMINTTFFPRTHVQQGEWCRIVPVGEYHGVPHDPSARVFHQEKTSIGSAGVFSTASDLLRCLAMLLDRGLSHRQHRIIQPHYIRALGKPATADVGPGFGLGAGLWNVFRRGMDESIVTSDTGFFKLGHTGCGIFCLPDYHVGVVILTDHMAVPKRSEVDRRLYAWFARITSILAQTVLPMWQEREEVNHVALLDQLSPPFYTVEDPP